MSETNSTVLERVRSWLPAVLSPVLIPVLGTGLLLFGVIVLGKKAADHLRHNDCCTIAFADIECLPAPRGPGFEFSPWQQDPVKFLAEVQYHGQMHNEFQLPDEDLKQQLEVAFARHSWVEKVDQIEIESRHVRVRLVYRVPVLIVKTPDRTRLVDSGGILLDSSATIGKRLPFLSGRIGPPRDSPGNAWSDRSVVDAAHTAAYLQRYQDRLHLESLEASQDGLILTLAAGTRVHWGQAPGAEATDEAKADQKVKKLLHYCDTHGGLATPGPCELDAAIAEPSCLAEVNQALLTSFLRISTLARMRQSWVDCELGVGMA